MSELLREYLPAILIAVLIGLVVGFLVFRPRQRVRLTDSAPVARTWPTRSARTSASHREAAAAACDVSGEIIGAPVHRHLSTGGHATDDLSSRSRESAHGSPRCCTRAASCVSNNSHTSTPEEIDLLDQQLGPFRGRIRRDRIVEQSAYLARGDIDGFEEHFGKL